MIATTVAPAAARTHFQFTLGMLLVAMAWSGLVCVALRSPTGVWTGALFVLTLLVLLTMVLVAIYRSGRLRAFGIGFLVFGAGNLFCLALVAGSLAGALRQGWTPVSGASAWLFEQLHPPTVVQQPAPWPGNGGIYGSMPGGGSPTGTGGMMTVSTPSPFDPQDFAVICNLAVSCLLGVVGGAVAQMLHATQRDGSVSS